jgi:D-alanyl-D-alanine carboxypeptidase
LIRQVIQAGVTRVTGSLVLTGPFSYSSYYTTLDAVRRLEAALRKLGVRVTKGTRLGAATGTVLASHKSAPLREIVYVQNVHSNNQTAERLGEALGGPWAVQEFLLRTVGIPSNEIHISRTSGLEYNRITPRATVKLLRHLVLWLNLRNLLPQDVLPIAGMQGGGTLSGRFTSVDYRGAVVGKTGTLPATDGGVSTLAGFLYTKDRGVILFAIFNTHGNVNTYRHMQDNLLKDLIVECGGADVTLSASWRKSNN